MTCIMDRPSVNRDMMAWGPDQSQSSLALGATETSAILMQRDLLPNDAVVGGLLKGKEIIKVERISAVTPGSSFHFQISYITAAALPSLLSKYIISFSLHCEIFTQQTTVVRRLFIDPVKVHVKVINSYLITMSPEVVSNRKHDVWPQFPTNVNVSRKKKGNGFK